MINVKLGYKAPINQERMHLEHYEMRRVYLLRN
jgi:hypothetical protein